MSVCISDLGDDEEEAIKAVRQTGHLSPGSKRRSKPKTLK